MITPGDRADLIVAAFAAHAAGQASVAGLVLTLGERARPPGARAGPGGSAPTLPVLLVRRDSFDTVAALSADWRAGCSAANPRKVEAALGAFESSVDTAELVRPAGRDPLRAGSPR